MYRNNKRYEIKYTDVDAFDNLKLSSLLSFMEESACLSADELGFGYKDISPKNIGFIIANSYVEFFRPVKLGEIIEVSTWPLKPKMMIFLREFEFFVNGIKVGAATTRWCMIDTKNFRLLPVSAYFKEGDFDNYNTERSIAFSCWKIPLMDSFDKCHSKCIKYSDCDHYFHANNTKYADFFMDTFSIEEMNGKYIGKFQISYVKQCKEGEIIDFAKKSENGAFFIEGRVDGETRVQAKVELNEV